MINSIKVTVKMQLTPHTIVIRHRRENLKKCSLSGLEGRPDFQFYRWPTSEIPIVKNYIYLTLDGPPLTAADNHLGLLLLDATWKRAQNMEVGLNSLLTNLTPRSLPTHYRTAYPRKQEDCCDPSRGLASIEALYIAYTLLGRNPEGLLDHYYWKEPFLTQNQL